MAKATAGPPTARGVAGVAARNIAGGGFQAIAGRGVTSGRLLAAGSAAARRTARRRGR